MHATHGKATATLPETAASNAARARWNQLKQAMRTPRTFRNGGKQRIKRLSKVMKARQVESAAAGGGGNLMDKEMTTNSEVETAVTIHVDEETGRRYSYDAATGQTQWLDKDDETTPQEKNTVSKVDE